MSNGSWICDRCGSSWGPMAIACNCAPKTVTSTDLTYRQPDEERLRSLLRRVLFEQGGSLPLALRDEIEKEVKP